MKRVIPADYAPALTVRLFCHSATVTRVFVGLSLLFSSLLQCFALHYNIVHVRQKGRAPTERRALSASFRSATPRIDLRACGGKKTKTLIYPIGTMFGTLVFEFELCKHAKWHGRSNR